MNTVLCAVILNLNKIIMLAIIATIASIAASEGIRYHRRKTIRTCTETATATVISIYPQSITRHIATYRYTDSPQDESQDDADTQGSFIIDAKTFNPNLVSIKENDEFEIQYDPSNPERVYVPIIDQANDDTTKGHVISQTLRSVILAELLLLARLT